MPCAARSAAPRPLTLSYYKHSFLSRTQISIPPAMPSMKSRIAFQFSMENFKTGLFLWTFTWPKPMGPKEGSRLWGNFLRGKSRSSPHGFNACFPFAAGLRVFEMHPGSDRYVPGLSHGLHVHAIIDRRLPVEIMRSIWEDEANGGRIHVRAIPAERAMYIGKYLAKQRVECMKGMRLWAPIGRAETSKVKDIVVDSRWTAAYRFLAVAMSGFSNLRWDQRARITTRFSMGEDMGAALESIGMVRERNFGEEKEFEEPEQDMNGEPFPSATVSQAERGEA